MPCFFVCAGHEIARIDPTSTYLAVQQDDEMGGGAEEVSATHGGSAFPRAGYHERLQLRQLHFVDIDLASSSRTRRIRHRVDDGRCISA